MVVRAVTMPVNAPPMMTATARSITLPRLMNSLNSTKNFFMLALWLIGQNVYPKSHRFT